MMAETNITNDMVLRKKIINITLNFFPYKLELEEFTSFFEERGYCPQFAMPLLAGSSKARIYHDNKIRNTSVSYETANLIINRPEGVLEFSDGRASIEIKSTYPFQIMDLLLNKYPENPSNRQILEITRGILGDKKTRDDSIRQYFYDLRKILGEKILPPRGRQFNSAVKIVEIIK